MKSRLLGIVQNLLCGRAGFTLVEMMIVVSILTVGVGTVGTTVFQVLSVQRFWQDDVIATKEVRHAASWFAGDALRAETTDLVDGGPSASSVTLTWTDGDSVSHTATYSLAGDTLLRNFDGAQNEVASGVVSVSFSLSGQVLTLSLEVSAERGTTETLNLETYLRALR